MPTRRKARADFFDHGEEGEEQNPFYPGGGYLGKNRSRVCASDKGAFFTTRKSLKGVQNSRKSLIGVQNSRKKELSLSKGYKNVRFWRKFWILGSFLREKISLRVAKSSKFSLSKGRFSRFGSNIPVISQT